MSDIKFVDYKIVVKLVNGQTLEQVFDKSVSSNEAYSKMQELSKGVAWATFSAGPANES